MQIASPMVEDANKLAHISDRLCGNLGLDQFFAIRRRGGRLIPSNQSPLLFFLEHLYSFPRFVRRSLFVFEGTLQIHLGQQIVGIEFQES